MTKQQFRDIVNVLQYVMQKIPPTDSVRASLNRLVVDVSEEEAHDRREELKTRRSRLIVSCAKEADRKKHLNTLASDPRAHWSAQRAADLATAEHDKLCKELASVEAALKDLKVGEAA